MRTYRKFECIHVDGTRTIEPSVFCDICGWGDYIARSDSIYDFCGRHKDSEIDGWLELERNQLSLFEDEYVKRLRIIENNPSKCYDCEHARRTASLELRDQGFTGCSIFVQEKLQISEKNVLDHVQDFKDMGTGWVSLKRRVFEDDRSDGLSKGVITNFQLITRGVTKCNQFLLRREG